MIRVMKHAFAIVLLCLPAQLSAGERCTASNADRPRLERAQLAKPVAARSRNARPQDVALLRAWQRSVVFEPQIL